MKNRIIKLCLLVSCACGMESACADAQTEKACPAKEEDTTADEKSTNKNNNTKNTARLL